MIIAFKKKEEKINIKDTILITALSLPILVFFSSIPLYLDKNINYFADAFFEATSGLTTTGASIYENINNLSKGILIWRALLQWIGGLGIIIFAIAIIPIFNIGGIKLFTQDWNEEPLGLHYRSKELAKTFLYLQYSGPEDTLDLQHELAKKYKESKIDDAIESLNFDGDLGDMTRGELHLLKSFLDTEDTLNLLTVPAL